MIDSGVDWLAFSSLRHDQVNMLLIPTAVIDYLPTTGSFRGRSWPTDPERI